VERDGNTITCDAHVGLEVIEAEPGRAIEGNQRVLRAERSAAAVGDRDRPSPLAVRQVPVPALGEQRRHTARLGGVTTLGADGRGDVRDVQLLITVATSEEFRGVAMDRPGPPRHDARRVPYAPWRPGSFPHLESPASTPLRRAPIIVGRRRRWRSSSAVATLSTRRSLPMPC